MLFSRAPIPGSTKTRLIPTVGSRQACALHVACLQDILEAAHHWHQQASAQRQIHLFITPANTSRAFATQGIAFPTWLKVHNQASIDNLGIRMEKAIASVQKNKPQANLCILCGVDLPLLHAGCWQMAEAALQKTDVVFGPTPDGGYYLVGMRVAPTGVFNLPRWGQGSVLKQSMVAAKRRGFLVECIDSLPDVDEEKDLISVLQHPLAQTFAMRNSVRYVRMLSMQRSPPHP